MPPFYPLKQVKSLIRANHYRINPNALQTAKDDFEWDCNDIAKCLLKLNGKDYAADTTSNHFYKTEDHNKIPHTKMDYYKMREAPDGFKVYTHFYVRNDDGMLIISSFKELEL